MFKHLFSICLITNINKIIIWEHFFYKIDILRWASIINDAIAYLDEMQDLRYQQVMWSVKKTIEKSKLNIKNIFFFLNRLQPKQSNKSTVTQVVTCVE